MTPEDSVGSGQAASTPPDRVRVTAPIAQARRAPGHPVAREIAEQSEVGQVYVRSLIRTQLRLALVVAVGFLLILLAFPLLIAFVPGLEQAELFGVPFSWLALGVGVYPIILLSAWLYLRAAARNEARYRDLVDDA
ncbi:DUF485 domain-containing protein [Cryobacterium fucosi]|uniref:DUF485 domain-containing protein n=1 Tax=Cryobacterium fucosi TaxID=1259157 RepID=A0A4R9BA24_9MICO|nr:DUF485 domain-containing protein [Cryobacterium fucosi]TFD79251.1 DUF485 domain-containing protein [Cryobacterium fucosi]